MAYSEGYFVFGRAFEAESLDSVSPSDTQVELFEEEANNSSIPVNLHYSEGTQGYIGFKVTSLPDFGLAKWPVMPEITLEQKAQVQADIDAVLQRFPWLEKALQPMGFYIVWQEC